MNPAVVNIPFDADVRRCYYNSNMYLSSKEEEKKTNIN